MRFIAEDLPPPLAEQDTVIRTDHEWEAAAKAYLQFKEGAEEADARLDKAKAQLVGLASHTSEKGAGVSVSKFWKVGAINYKNVPALAGVYLEKYRGAAREEVRVSVAK
jgi:hypothetical protein